MRILLCPPNVLDRRLGASQVYLELADSLQQHGCDVTVANPTAIGMHNHEVAPECLRRFLIHEAGRHDVVEYEHVSLPYPRYHFSSRPLFVARVVLLAHHFLTVPIPPRPGLLRGVKFRLTARSRRKHIRERATTATQTCRAADLINVANASDAELLLEHGLPGEKIVVLPYGLSPSRRGPLEALPDQPPATPRLGVIGTFDPRKGMHDVPWIFERVLRAVPACRLRLLGTQGMLRTAEEVLRCFPRPARHRVEVVPRYEPSELPCLLKDVSVGLFPSRVESFGLGVLEMMVAAIPVIAYAIPGPSSLLLVPHLVSPGRREDFASRLIELLDSGDRLHGERVEARARSAPFDWDAIAQATLRHYRAALAARP